MKFDTEKEFALYVKDLGGVAYLVGGAVRDQIMNKPVNDKDYVLVGINIKDIPFERVVGNSFPVFLIEISGEKCEIALARTERKVHIGHKGFEFNTSSLITIEQDLQRRDFTMNSIAQKVLTKEIIDPFNGIFDIKNKLIRSNNEAFLEDPLRILRAARFATTLSFDIEFLTQDYMWDMAESLNELSPERVFKEMEKSINCKAPSKFFKALEETGCLGYLYPGWFSEISKLCGVQAGPVSSKHGIEDTFTHTMNAIDHRVLQTPLERFAVLCHDFGKALSSEPPKHHGHEKAGLIPVKEFCDRLKVPNKYKKAALCFAENHMRMHKIKETRSGKAARLITNVHKTMPGGLESFLRCSQADGMSQSEAKEILSRGRRVLDVMLPKEYYNRGSQCAEILLNLQGKEWIKSKNE